VKPAEPMSSTGQREIHQKLQKKNLAPGQLAKKDRKKKVVEERAERRRSIFDAGPWEGPRPAARFGGQRLRVDMRTHFTKAGKRSNSRLNLLFDLT